MSFMISLRKADQSKGVAAPRYLVIDDTNQAIREIPKANDWADEVLAAFPQTAGVTGRVRPAGELLFLVHGFNVSQEAALKFHSDSLASLRKAGWNGELISYDWPSDGLVFAYLPDRANARASASQLVRSGISLLESRQRRDCAINVHLMAHSMGAFVTQQAVTWAYQDVPPGWTLGQVLLVAGDVDYTVFSANNTSAVKFDEHAGRLTAYCNRFDKALLVSNVKKIGLAPRLGRVGLPDDSPQMMAEVDCSDLFTAVDPGLGNDLDPVATHCFYFGREEFWQDAVLTLAGGIDRSVYPNRSPAIGARVANRFSLQVGPLAPDTYARALGRATSA